MNKTKKTLLTWMLALGLVLTLIWAAGASAAGTVDATAAENLALAEAGVSREQATLLRTETETEHGRSVYDVEFRCDGFEYEYWVAADDGTIVKRSWELAPEKALEMAGFQSAGSECIGEDAALNRALTDAGLTAQGVTVMETGLDADNLLQVYEISFCTADAEYEYDIDAITGAVCGVSIEYFAEGETRRPGQRPAGEEAAQAVTRESARSIALADAGLSAGEVTFTKSKLDREDGKWVYEIEFITGDAEYEYEIDAATGAILEKSVEGRKSSGGSTGSANYIGVDQAKAIALKNAGLSAGEVTFTKAKLEKDDGVRKYEIEFRKGGTEYEYEIDAATGAILECDVDREDEPARPAEPSHDDDDDDDRYDDDHDEDDDRYDDDDDDDDDDRYDDDDDDDDD